MNLIEGYQLSYDTEGAMFGINHNGTGFGYVTNWFLGSAYLSTANPPASFPADGVFYWIDGQAGGETDGDFLAFAGNGNVTTNTGWKFIGETFAATYATAFKSTTNITGGGWSPGIYSEESEYGPVVGGPDPGIPANYSAQSGGDETNWSNVEIKQMQATDGSYDVTMSINKTPVFTYHNTTGLFTNGTIMLGYEDPFNSIGSDSAAYYSNIRVVQLGPISITSQGILGNNFVINFTSTDGDDSPASFLLQSTAALGPVVNGVSQPATWTTVSSATITQTAGTLAFTATTPLNGPQQFYRIVHK